MSAIQINCLYSTTITTTTFLCHGHSNKERLARARFGPLTSIFLRRGRWSRSNQTGTCSTLIDPEDMIMPRYGLSENVGQRCPFRLECVNCSALLRGRACGVVFYSNRTSQFPGRLARILRRSGSKDQKFWSELVWPGCSRGGSAFLELTFYSCGWGRTVCELTFNKLHPIGSLRSL